MDHFQTTRWSLVIEARADDAQSQRALETLCRTYRAPVLAYIRGRGATPEDAEDLAQAFFARFVDRAFHAHADPARDRFRAFLLTALKNFLADAHDSARTLKRGGEVQFHSLDSVGGESGAALAATETPEQAFDRAWSQALLHGALRRLRQEAREGGKLALFDALREFVIEPPDEADYARVAQALQMRRNTLAVAVHRMRNRLRDLIFRELADTAADGADIESELRHLHDSLGAFL